MKTLILTTLNGWLSSTRRLARGNRAVALAAALALSAGYGSAQSEKPLTYVDILHQLTDQDHG